MSQTAARVTRTTRELRGRARRCALHQAARLVRQWHHWGEDIGVVKEAVETNLAVCAGPMEARLAGERVPGGHVSA
jgi:hypothetical protein